MYSSLAQSVEHSAVNRVVLGSSPTGGATKLRRDIYGPFFVGSLSIVGESQKKE